MKSLYDQLENNEQSQTIEFGPLEIVVTLEQEYNDMFSEYDCYGTISHNKSDLVRGETIRFNIGRDYVYWTYPEDMHQDGKNHKAWKDYAHFIEARKSLRSRIEDYFDDEWYMACVSVKVFCNGQELGCTYLGMVESDYAMEAIKEHGMFESALEESKQIISEACNQLEAAKLFLKGA